MYKYIILLKILTTDTHTDVLLKGGEKLTLRKDNPHYEYCVEALNFALDYNKPVGAIIAEGEIIEDVVRSRSGIVSDFYTHKGDKLGVAMLPLDGIYYLSKSHPYYERFRLVLVESQQHKKKVNLFLRPGAPTDIVDVRLAD